MPASTIGAMNSWGVYLIASVALIGVLSPQLVGVTRDSREGADWRNADGIRAVLDALRPGMVITFSFGAWSTSDEVYIGGNLVSVSYGNGTISLPTTWSLPDVVLSPSVSYRAWLDGDEVQVTRAG